MKNIFMIFIIVSILYSSNCLITYQVPQDVLLKSQWRFSNDNGFLGNMKFQSNGDITGYSNPNEKYWALDSGYLVIKNQNKVATTKFVRAFKDHFGKWQVEGRFLGLNNGWRHYLTQI